MNSDCFELLENAAWPAFVVEGGGTIRRANQAAITFFGPKLEAESTSLTALWPAEHESAESFLSHWERSAIPMVALRFAGKGGTVLTFNSHISASYRDGQKRFLFQLLPSAAAGAELPVSSAKAPAMTPAAAAPGPAPAPAPALAPDSSLVQKQRLDCALQLTRTVAMDYNSVLTSILGHTSLVLSKMELSHPFRGSLLEVEKAAGKAAEITQHLAAFSRPEKESPSQGNVNSLLRRTVALFQQTPSGINYGLLLDPKPHAVRFDEAKVLQAFVKIIENAREALGEYGSIRVASRPLDLTAPMDDGTAHLQPGFYICVEISDDGPGMAPDTLARAFEPFFTTKAGHRGLGLAWVYGIVTNHGGSVAISSQPGQGTSVRVYLPATSTASAPLTAPESAARNPTNGCMQTILMVDDEDLLLTMGEAILSSAGYRVMTANNGQKALDIMAKGRPIDLVITDLVMPLMSGRELVEQIKARSPDLPVLRISGYVRPNGVIDGASYLQKPFTRQDLLRHVKQALDGSEGN